MADLPMEPPTGAVPDTSEAIPAPKPKRGPSRAPSGRGPDFTVESLEGRDPPNNFQMLYDMALAAMLRADDYTQVSFASAPNRRPWQADEILAEDNWTLGATSAHAGGGGGSFLDPPPQAIAAADLFVGLNAGHPDLGFVHGLSRFDFGDAVFAGMAFDDGGQHQLAARPGGDAHDSPIFGDLAGSTIATSQLLSDTVLLDSPYIGPPSHGVPTLDQGLAAGDDSAEADSGESGDDGSGDGVGTRSVPDYPDYRGTAVAHFNDSTDNLKQRFSLGVSALTNRFASESNAFSAGLNSGFSSASAHISYLYGPTASAISPYDTAASAASLQYSTMASRLQADFSAFYTEASNDMISATGSLNSEYTTAVTQASSRYSSAMNDASTAFSSLVAPHLAESLYLSSASNVFYNTITPAAAAMSSSATSRASAHSGLFMSNFSTDYVAALTTAAGQFTSALDSGSSLFSEVLASGNDSDERARAAALAAYGSASLAIADARSDMLADATSAMNSATGYAWSLYDGAIGRTSPGRVKLDFDAAVGVADSAYTDASGLLSSLSGTSYSAPSVGDPASRGDIDSYASGITSSAQHQRDLIDAAWNSGSNSNSSAASLAASVGTHAVADQFSNVGLAGGSVSSQSASYYAPATASMNTSWNSRTSELDSAWYNPLTSFSAATLPSSSTLATTTSAAYNSITTHYTSATSGYAAARDDITGGTTGAGTGPAASSSWSFPTTSSGSSTSFAIVQEKFATWLPGLRTRIGANPSQYFVTQPDGPDVQLLVVGADYPSGFTTETFTYLIPVTDTDTTPNGDVYTLDQTVYVFLERNVDESGHFTASARYLVTDIDYTETQTITHTETQTYYEGGASVSRNVAVFETVSFSAAGAYWYDLTASGTFGATIAIDGYKLDERRQLTFTLANTGNESQSWSATRADSTAQAGYVLTGDADRTWNDYETGIYRNWNIVSGGSGGYAASSSYDGGLLATRDSVTAQGNYERGIWISAGRTTGASGWNTDTAHNNSTLTQSQTWSHALGTTVAGGMTTTTAGTVSIATNVEIRSETAVSRNLGADAYKYLNTGSYVLTAFRLKGNFELSGATGTASGGSETFDSLNQRTVEATQTATLRQSSTASLSNHWLQSATINGVSSSAANKMPMFHTETATVTASMTGSDIAHSVASFTMEQRSYRLVGSANTFTMASQTDVATNGSYFGDSWRTDHVQSTHTATGNWNRTDNELVTRPTTVSSWQAAFSGTASATAFETYTQSGSASADSTASAFDRAAYGRQALRVIAGPTRGPTFGMYQTAESLSAGTLFSTNIYGAGELFGERVATGSTKAAFGNGDNSTLSHSNEFETAAFTQGSTEYASLSSSYTASASHSGTAYAKENYSLSWLDDIVGVKDFYNEATRAATAKYAQTDHATASEYNEVTANFQMTDSASVNASYYQGSSSALISHSHTGNFTHSYGDSGDIASVGFGSDSSTQTAVLLNDRDPYLFAEQFALGFATATMAPQTAASDATVTSLDFLRGQVSDTASTVYGESESRPDFLRTAGGTVTTRNVTATNPDLGALEFEGEPPPPNPQSVTIVGRNLGVDWYGSGVETGRVANRYGTATDTQSASGAWFNEASIYGSPSLTLTSPGPLVVLTSQTSATYSEVATGLGLEPFTVSNNYKSQLDTTGQDILSNLGRSIDFGVYVLTSGGRSIAVDDNYDNRTGTQSATHTGYVEGTTTAAHLLIVKETATAIASYTATATATPAVPASSSAAESTRTVSSTFTDVANRLAHQTAYGTDLATQTGTGMGRMFDFGSGSAANSGFVWSDATGSETQTLKTTAKVTSHDIATPGYLTQTITSTVTSSNNASAMGLAYASGSEIWRQLDDNAVVNKAVDAGSALDWASQTNGYTSSDITKGTWSEARSQVYTATATETGTGLHSEGGFQTYGGTAYDADIDRLFQVGYGSAQPTAVYVDSQIYSGASSLYSAATGSMTEAPISYTSLSENITANWTRTESAAGKQSNYRSYHVAVAENASLAPVDWERAPVSATEVHEGVTTTSYYPAAVSAHFAKGTYSQKHLFKQAGTYTTVPTDKPYANTVTRDLTTQFQESSYVFGSGIASDNYVQYGNMALGFAGSQSATATVGDSRWGSTSLTLTESGSYSRTLPSSETQSGTFHSRDTEAHSFSYYGIGLYSSTRGAAFLGGHADWSGGADDSTLSAAGGRSGAGAHTFEASGSFRLANYSLGLVGSLTPTSASATATGFVTVTDSGSFSYSEINYDLATAHDEADGHYGRLDAMNHYATDTASQAFTFTSDGKSTYDKTGVLVSGAVGLVTLKDVESYSQATAQLRIDSDATRAVQLNGEHLTSASHNAHGSLVKQSSNNFSHSFSATAAYGFSGGGSGTMAFVELGTNDYRLTDAYNYTDSLGRAEDRSWSIGDPYNATHSFVAHNSKKDQTGNLWQSESASYQYSLVGGYTTSATVPGATGNSLMAPPGGDALLFADWSDSAAAYQALGDQPAGLDDVYENDYTGWFSHQPAGFTTTGAYAGTETYQRIDYNNVDSTYNHGTATFGFEDATPTGVTVVDGRANQVASNVVYQSMTQTYFETLPHSVYSGTKMWVDRELDTATASSSGFRIDGNSMSPSQTCPMSMSQDFSLLSVPAASYYVQALIADTQGSTASSQSMTYTDGAATLSHTITTISNATTAWVNYGDVADSSRVDATFAGEFTGTSKVERITHTFENTTGYRADSSWDVLFRQPQDGYTKTAVMVGSGGYSTTTASDYYRTVDMTDIVMAPGIEVHYTHTVERGAHWTETLRSFTQKQTWPDGTRDGVGDHGSFSGGIYGGDSGNTGDEVVGADFGDNAYYEVGHKNPKVYDVRYHGVNHESMVSLPPDGVTAWSAPAQIADRDVDYSVSFSNTSNYTLIGYSKDFAKGRPHAHSKITRGAVDGTLTTSYSLGGSGTYSNSYSVTAHHAIDYWGTDSYVVDVPIVAGDLQYFGSHSAETAVAVDGTQVWKDWGDWTTSSTWLNVGGLATSTYNSYVLHGTVSRNQWQEIDDSTDLSGTGTVSWHGGETGHIGYPPPPFEDESGEWGIPPSPYGDYTYTQNGSYSKASDRGGYVSFDSEAKFTRNNATPMPSLTPDVSVRLIDVVYVTDLEESHSVSNYSSHSGSATSASGYAILVADEGDSHHYTTAGTDAQDRYSRYTELGIAVGYPPSSTVLPFSTSGTYSTPFLNSVSYPQVGDPVFPSLLANAFTPALRSNLFYLAAHPELTDRRAADQMRLKDRVAPKGPGQVGEFNQLGSGDGQGNKLRVTPAGIHEGASVPANELAGKQGEAIATETGKPLQGSQAKGLSPETIDGSLAKRTGNNGGEPQIVDPGRLSGDAGNIHFVMLGFAGGTDPDGSDDNMPRLKNRVGPDDQTDHGFGRKYGPEELLFKRPLYPGGEDFDRETAGGKNPYARHPWESYEWRKTQSLAKGQGDGQLILKVDDEEGEGGTPDVFQMSVGAGEVFGGVLVITGGLFSGNPLAILGGLGLVGHGGDNFFTGLNHKITLRHGDGGEPYHFAQTDTNQAFVESGFDPDKVDAYEGAVESIGAGIGLSALLDWIWSSKSVSTEMTLDAGEGLRLSVSPSKGNRSPFELIVNGKNGILAEIDDAGIVLFKINAEGSSVRGTEMFRQMMEHFGSEVKGIRGYWVSKASGSGNLNLGRVNQLTAAGMSLEEAVGRAWTANRARDFGFTKFRILAWKDTAGNYDMIEVIFTK